MSSALQSRRMTREEFLDWADAQEARYEFDGVAPVAMNGGLIDHSRIIRNIGAALVARLEGSGCETLGPGAGVATVENAVRYPDALITCTRTPGTDRLVAGVTVVFEVLSSGNPGVDRITKVQEYWAVPSIHPYIRHR